MDRTMHMAMFVVAFAACGSRDDESAQLGQVDQAKARTSARAMASGALIATRENDGPRGLIQLLSGAIEAQSILSQSYGIHVASSAPRLQALQTCTCTEAACTYVNCAPTGTTGILVNGTVSWTTTSLKCDKLTYAVNVSGATTNVTLDCDLAVTPTTLSGSVRSVGTAALGNLVQSSSVQISDIGWSSTTQLSNVTYDDKGLTGGSARVDVSSSIGDQAYTGSADVTFP